MTYYDEELWLVVGDRQNWGRGETFKDALSYALKNGPDMTQAHVYHLQHLRKRGDRDRYGDKGYLKGWEWWKPGSWPSDAPDRYMQDMDFHIAGARAFQAVLAEHGITATVGSRLD